MPTVYITASNRWTALFFKEHLECHGHVVTSTWHGRPMVPTKDILDFDKPRLVEVTRELIKEADFLLIIADPDQVPGGKFVDAGVALGNGKRVILVGRRENLKMYDPLVTQVDDHWGVTKVLTDVQYPVSSP